MDLSGNYTDIKMQGFDLHNERVSTEIAAASTEIHLKTTLCQACAQPHHNRGMK